MGPDSSLEQFDGFPGVSSYEQLIAGYQPLAQIPNMAETTASAACYTTGTTGRPKGIMLTQLNWVTMIANYYATVDPGPDPVHLCVAPMTHAAGVLALTLMAAGGTSVILPGFDAAWVAAAIEAEGVTHLFLPPTAIYMLLAYPGLGDHDHSSLRQFMYAAAPMAIDKLRECLKTFGPVMMQTFGQAESPMFCTRALSRSKARRSSSFS